MGNVKQESQLLRIDEVADYLNVSKRTIQRCISTGEIKAAHIGRSVRVPVQEIERYIGRSASGRCGHEATTTVHA